ncbi:response regulator transcription factor [Streptomyces liangshanensis]|uniref:Response regulator transcription factor n=1 Tax=Streptomyces liangshanensis TaxID=2717324 RepID=A0A6G9H2R4_9ACTN|nr:response regulator transcription factor [Streptomyces liangshanensis]QIQ04511.1 response regulator transcription factor [Streptomyces liangshanensis]
MCAYVVVAEDDKKQAELVRRYLEREGHDVVVVHDGRAALEQVRHRPPDLLVLDVMMPKVDGLDVCRILRTESDLPVLMLTARSTEDDLLLGLDLGADDYMTKPFSPRELMARIRSLLRRSARTVAAAPAPDPVLTVGALRVDPGRHEVWAHGRRIECTPGEFRLLEVLAERPGQVFTRAQILEQLHGFDRYITSRTVDVHVMNLRKKIEPHPRRARTLVTVYGVGYKLADGEAAGAGTGAGAGEGGARGDGGGSGGAEGGFRVA